MAGGGGGREMDRAMKGLRVATHTAKNLKLFPNFFHQYFIAPDSRSRYIGQGLMPIARSRAGAARLRGLQEFIKQCLSGFYLCGLPAVAGIAMHRPRSPHSILRKLAKSL